jgi:glyoxylase-like metal-dependent hydrolase (beta-lactamase superfamily II)
MVLTLRPLGRHAGIENGQRTRRHREGNAMSDFQLSRRYALAAGTAALGAGAVGLPSTTSLAKAPRMTSQTSYFYRFDVGKMQVTMLSDGPLPLGDPSTNFLGAGKAEITKMLTDNYLSPTQVVLEQNIPLVNTGTHLVLFDTGMGTLKMFGPTTGRLMTGFREAGVQPSQVDAVVISHGHIDHIGGLVDAANRRLFPNAKVYISQADFDFWTDEKKLADAKVKTFIEHARKNLLPYRDRIVFVKDGQEILPGITAMATPGHTVGHMIYMLNSDGKQACFIGDLTHHQILLVERPRLEFAYDTDPKQSAQSRVKALEMFAKDRTLMLAFHFPWPGAGYVSKQGDGFRYHAQPMEIVRIPAQKT